MQFPLEYVFIYAFPLYFLCSTHTFCIYIYHYERVCVRECRYRVQQGSFDDFAIDNETGLVTISRKLDFDRRNHYSIEVVASDLGMN